MTWIFNAMLAWRNCAMGVGINSYIVFSDFKRTYAKPFFQVLWPLTWTMKAELLYERIQVGSVFSWGWDELNQQWVGSSLSGFSSLQFAPALLALKILQHQLHHHQLHQLRQLHQQVLGAAWGVRDDNEIHVEVGMIPSQKQKPSLCINFLRTNVEDGPV